MATWLILQLLASKTNSREHNFMYIHSCKMYICMLVSYAVNWEIFVYDNIHVLNIHVNKFLWMPMKIF